VAKNLVLVDYENVHQVDLSVLDETYRAIIFVGATQNPPRAASNPATAHRFTRVDFLKVEATGKNALDFHIAFQLGRTFETAPDTVCIVLSKDKGFDPLLSHLNKNGLTCRRISSLDELSPKKAEVLLLEPVCKHCKKSSTVEHYGGRWCSNCGCFAVPPDPSQLPSNQRGYVDRSRDAEWDDRAPGTVATCEWCHQRVDMTGGIYDDGEWMCGGCISRLAR
jgi:hypothetical protein